MNSQALSDKARHLAKKYGVTSNFIINHYFFDAVLKRISESTHQNHFILKGGYLLSIDLGIFRRTTNDLDFSLSSVTLDESLVKKTIQDILAVDMQDSVEFELLKIERIKDSEGLRLKLLAHLGQIRHPISIDITTNDPVTPNSILKPYSTIIDHDEIHLWIYPYETILAEKLQTVVSLGVASSRAKDLYDLYIIDKMISKELNFSTVKEAVKHTFKYRNTSVERNRIVEELNEIRNSETQKRLWNRYADQHYFSKDIAFEVIMNSIDELVCRIFDT